MASLANHIRSHKLFISLVIIVAFVMNAIGMEPQIKSIIRKTMQKKQTKRVAFKAGTMYVCWNSWRNRLFTDSYLPLTPLFDPSLVCDWGLIEVEDISH